MCWEYFWCEDLFISERAVKQIHLQVWVMENRNFLHNADNPFMLHHSKQCIHMGIYSGKTPLPEDQAPPLGCAFKVGNFWLRSVGIFHTMHQRAETLRIIIPTLESTWAKVRALLWRQFKHYPLHLLLKILQQRRQPNRETSGITELSSQWRSLTS